MYKKFTTIWVSTHNNLDYLQDELSSLKGRFFNLFRANDYKNFINHTFSLTHNFTNLVDNVSMELSNLKEEANSVMIFGMAPASEIEKVIESFTSAPFTLASREMFQRAKELQELAEAVVDILSYDIIIIIVAGKYINDYFSETIETFTNGTNAIESQFRVLCDSFIDLDALVTQDYLNNIDSNFREMVNVLNETIFPNVTLRLEQIK